MYPMPTTPIQPFAPGASFLSPGMLQGAGQLSQLPLQQGMLGQSGGLLSKLIGGVKAGGGGITSIINMLQNAQKAIGTLQSVAPFVQQYGPLVKSLPALISAMTSSGSSAEEASDDHNEIVKDSHSNNTKKKSTTMTPTKKKANIKKSRKQQKKSKKSAPKSISKGIPAPKLYI
ncbi:VrrA/YqfQ family protein [Bacillaceae bacterium IKA-2]|nr:VrrA/YqfQ family protein [Bacillaceae bacterium IKA-2]